MQNASRSSVNWPDLLSSHQGIFIVEFYSLDVDENKNTQIKHWEH